MGQHGTDEEQARARTLREQVRAIVAEKKAERLRKKLDEISDVYSSILYRQASFWVDYFETLARSEAEMHDTAKATRLLAEGRGHVAANNLPELKNVVFQLQDLLPKKVADEARRGYGSGIVT